MFGKRHAEDLWFGGVDFRGFIRDRMPVAAHQVFFERVARSQDMRFHIADGRVRPAYTGLRVTVMAMLARHEGRVPLSRVMELVART